MVSALERAHLLLYCQAVSDCGRYAAYGTNFGHLVVYDLGQAVGKEASQADAGPLAVVRVFENSGIYSLASARAHLVCGGPGAAVAYKWRDLTRSAKPRPAWTLQVPQPGPEPGQLPSAEVNSMAKLEIDSSPRLAAGCGDRRLHLFDLETGQCVASTKPAGDYIHKVTSCRQLLASASEDGSVRIYDSRRLVGEPQIKLIPSQYDELARPGLGTWVSCLAGQADSADWLVCGGGPQLAMWHIASAAPTAVLRPSDSFEAHDALLDGDRVLVAGSASSVYYFSPGGALQAAAACSAPQLFSLGLAAPTAEGKQLVSACGLGNRIDLCSGIGYKLASLAV